MLTKCCAKVVGVSLNEGFFGFGNIMQDEMSHVLDGITTPSVPTDCHDAGCPDGEECQSSMSHGSTRHICACPAGYERDNNTQHCKAVSQSGLYVWH